MSLVTTRKASLVALAMALAGGSAAMADQPVGHGPVQMPQGNPNAPACAAGFTAAQATIVGSNPYGQSYTCTGPTIVCSTHFTPQDPVVGSTPAPPGQLIGKTFYGSPVVIKNGRMVYTCAEPQPPPK
jgi:hypothetical protein